MKNSTEYAKKFKKWCKKLPACSAEVHEEGAIEELVYSQLLWNATVRQANAAFRKLKKSTIDLNDLRMNMPHETIGMIGVTYPQVEERARRLRAILRGIYLREHDVNFNSLVDAGKIEIREYIQSLEGMTHFVSGRVLSLCFNVSVFPVDDHTHQAMICEGLLHEDVTLDETAVWLSRQVNAKDVRMVHGSLHSWVEKQPVRKAPAKQKTVKNVTKKKVSKKKAAKKKVVSKKKVKMRTAKKTPRKKTTKK